MQDQISVLIADSHYLVRIGLKHLISNRNAFRLMDEAEDQLQLQAILKTKFPDVVILDPFQKDKFSLESIDLIRTLSPKSGILVIAADQRRNSVYEVLGKGVNCFLTKECDDREILEAILSASTHDRFFCKKILNFIWEKSFGKIDDCTGTPLSAREVEILKLVAEGKITKEIAFKLKLSMHTVYTHRKNILRKLNLNSTPELVLYAVNQGFVESDRVQM